MGNITEEELMIIQRTINGRIRTRGLASREIILRRDIHTHKPKAVEDDILGDEQHRQRRKQHQNISDKKMKPDDGQFEVGDLVFIKNQLNKNKARETFMVTGAEDEMLQIQKFQNQFRGKKNWLYPSELTHALGPGRKVQHEVENRTSNEKPTDQTSKPESTKKLVKENKTLEEETTSPVPTAQQPLPQRPQRKTAIRARRAWEPLIRSVNSSGQKSTEVTSKFYKPANAEHDEDEAECIITTTRTEADGNLPNMFAPQLAEPRYDENEESEEEDEDSEEEFLSPDVSISADRPTDNDKRGELEREIQTEAEDEILPTKQRRPSISSRGSLNNIKTAADQVVLGVGAPVQVLDFPSLSPPPPPLPPRSRSQSTSSTRSLREKEKIQYAKFGKTGVKEYHKF